MLKSFSLLRTIGSRDVTTSVVLDVINEMNLSSFEVSYEHFKKNFHNFDENDFLEMIFKDLEMNFKDEMAFKDKPKNNFNENMNNHILNVIFSERQKEKDKDNNFNKKTGRAHRVFSEPRNFNTKFLGTRRTSTWTCNLT